MSKHPVTLTQGRNADAVVSGQIVGRARRSTSREIRGTGADHAVNSADPYRNHAAVRQRTETQPDIDLLPAGDSALDRSGSSYIDLRIGLEEVHQDRDEANAPDPDWGCDDQLAGRRDIFAGGSALGFRHFCENALARDNI